MRKFDRQRRKKYASQFRKLEAKCFERGKEVERRPPKTIEERLDYWAEIVLMTDAIMEVYIKSGLKASGAEPPPKVRLTADQEFSVREHIKLRALTSKAHQEN